MDAKPSAGTVGGALARGAVRLRGTPGALLDAQLLLGHALARPRGALLADPQAPVAPAELRRFERSLERRARGEPLAYITGRREFWSLELQVTPAVLVPRPETELVVERALVLVPQQTARVADLGTGSGAIALALAHERPGWRVSATDRSAAALEVAAANARALGLGNVRWLAGDWCEPLAGERFELIASNPPYVAAADAALADPALRHEPREALCSGPTGLEALAAIIAAAAPRLQEQGWLVLEHGADQAAAVAGLLVAQGYRHVRCHADLAGLPRVTEAQPALADTTQTQQSSPP